jgi:2-oxoglutarate dehydrogenase E1 component
VIDQYPQLKEVVWAQEEPRNQGAWFFMLSRRHLAGMIKPRQSLQYAGRDYSASPAAGHLQLHLAQQRALVGDALDLHRVAAVAKRSA